MSESMWRVAVVGAGPAGMYAADALSKRDDVSVDIFDRVFAPYGLLRYGVAPDHPSIKGASKPFDAVRGRARVRFLGGVSYGDDIDLKTLQAQYHAVVFAVGASSERRLGVPGEELCGIFSSRVFVEWYNGHPDMAEAIIPLDVKQAIVVGAGNVALDVARILARPTSDMGTTDIADHALAQLMHSEIERVHLFMRRGPLDVAFTFPELRALAAMDGVYLEVDERDVEDIPPESPDAPRDRAVTRILEVLQQSAKTAPPTKPHRTLQLHFNTSLVEAQGAHRLERVRARRNAVGADGRLLPVEGSEFELPAGLCISAIGYRGAPLADLPFDAAAGTIPSEDAGAVLGVPGVWVTGWARRGPSGVIGTNKADAVEVANAVLATFAGLPPVRAPRALADEWPFSDEWWDRVDAIERQRGEPQGRPRVKFVAVEVAEQALLEQDDPGAQRRA